MLINHCTFRHQFFKTNPIDWHFFGMGWNSQPVGNGLDMLFTISCLFWAWVSMYVCIYICLYRTTFNQPKSGLSFISQDLSTYVQDFIAMVKWSSFSWLLFCVYRSQFFLKCSMTRYQKMSACKTPEVYLLTFIELDDGKIYRKALYLMVKTMVSWRFSLKSIQWDMFHLQTWTEATRGLCFQNPQIRTIRGKVLHIDGLIKYTCMICRHSMTHLVGGLKHFLFFHIYIYWEWYSHLTNIFERGWNHQPAHIYIYTQMNLPFAIIKYMSTYMACMGKNTHMFTHVTVHMYNMHMW